MCSHTRLANNSCSCSALPATSSVPGVTECAAPKGVTMCTKVLCTVASPANSWEAGTSAGPINAHFAGLQAC